LQTFEYGFKLPDTGHWQSITIDPQLSYKLNFWLAAYPLKAASRSSKPLALMRSFMVIYIRNSLMKKTCFVAEHWIRQPNEIVWKIADHGSTITQPIPRLCPTRCRRVCPIRLLVCC